ncbi:MAG: UDP-N-acetylmuramate dehydrogenase [Oscillospiraceae bacterium]|nr:UDP-N-acetylmuramate dehydrogenase [Oscillospiraceae bacterium]
MKYLREFVTLLQLADIPLKQGEPMCRHTSFQIGGPVAVMVFPENVEQMQEIFKIAAQFHISPMILGAGSNILAPDQGLDTVVIETRTNMNQAQRLEDGTITAQCGMTMARLATIAMEHGYTGLEFAHGIPGTVGGGVYMNAGAYGGEMQQVVTNVTAMDRKGHVLELPAEELRLSYRHSRFMEEDLVILSATVRLQKGEREEIRAKMAELMTRRRTSQPLEYPSAGSTFKRPVGGYAAALIEASGLKGFRVGDAQVSEKHAGFVVNRGRATSHDVLELMKQVQEKVQADSGICLEPEVRILEVQKPCAF